MRYQTARIVCTEAHLPTPRYGQYLTHEHNHITPAVAAMDSSFAILASVHNLFGSHSSDWVVRNNFPGAGVDRVASRAN